MTAAEVQFTVLQPILMAHEKKLKCILKDLKEFAIHVVNRFLLCNSTCVKNATILNSYLMYQTVANIFSNTLVSLDTY